MQNRRKYLIIFFIILAALLAFGLLMLFIGGNGCSCSSKGLFRKSQRQENKMEEYQSMLPGIWQSGTHVYYRFNDDGTGCTWDTDDDLTEDEASPFQWKVSNGQLVLSHQMRMAGFIPRMYHIDAIDNGSLQFHDPYTEYTLTRLNR